MKNIFIIFLRKRIKDTCQKKFSYHICNTVKFKTQKHEE